MTCHKLFSLTILFSLVHVEVCAQWTHAVDEYPFDVQYAVPEGWEYWNNNQRLIVAAGFEPSPSADEYHFYSLQANGSSRIHWGINPAEAPDNYSKKMAHTFKIVFWVKKGDWASDLRRMWIDNYALSSQGTYLGVDGFLGPNPLPFWQPDLEPFLGNDFDDTSGNSMMGISDAGGTIADGNYPEIKIENGLNIWYHNSQSGGSERILNGYKIPNPETLDWGGEAISAPVYSWEYDDPMYLCWATIPLSQLVAYNRFTDDTLDGGISHLPRIFAGGDFRVHFALGNIDKILNFFSGAMQAFGTQLRPEPVVLLGRNSVGTVIKRETSTPNSSGKVRVSGGMVQASSTILACHRGYLRKAVQIFAGEPVDNGNMVPGDIDGDNEIGPADFEHVIAFFGKSSTDADWDLPTASVNPRDADFDRDGEIGPEEFEIVTENFGLVGDE